MTPTEKAAGGLLTEQGEAARWPSLRRSASLALKVGSNFVQEGPPIFISPPDRHEPPGIFILQPHGSARQPKVGVAAQQPVANPEPTS